MRSLNKRSPLFKSSEAYAESSGHCKESSAFFRQAVFFGSTPLKAFEGAVLKLIELEAHLGLVIYFEVSRSIKAWHGYILPARK